MKALYRLQDNSLARLLPFEPKGIDDSSSIIPCHEQCIKTFVDGKVYEEGKDFDVFEYSNTYQVGPLKYTYKALPAL